MEQTYFEFYTEFFGKLKPDSSGECAVECPFHLWNTGKEDDHPSMYVNVVNGKYDCKSCPERDDAYFSPRGDAIEFARAWFDIDFPQAQIFVTARLQGLVLNFPLSETYAEKLHAALLAQEQLVRELQERKLVNDNTIKAFKIGWDAATKRYTIPIRNYRDELVNVRRYSTNKQASGKMISLTSANLADDDDNFLTFHYGKARLWPHTSLERGQRVYVMAGEWDTLLALQMGLPAVTGTGGEGRWNADWDRWFVGKEVVIVYDIDKAGRSGADRVAHSLRRVAHWVKVIPLPITTPKNGDFTDYIMQDGTREAFEVLVDAVPTYESPKIKEISPQSRGEDAINIPLARSIGNALYHHKRVAIEAQVVGMGYQPFTLPREGSVTCTSGRPTLAKCNNCELFDNGGKMAFRFDVNHDLLRMIDTTDNRVEEEMRRLAGIPPTCEEPRFVPETYQNIDRVQITPNIVAGYVNGANGDDEHTLQLAYYVHGEDTPLLQANRAYKLTGARMTEPKRQEVIHLIDEIAPLEDSIATFELTPEIHEQLARAFKPESAERLRETVDGLSHALTEVVTHVYGREDLVTAILLWYCSVQQFAFAGTHVDSGLLEFICIGDTRTGKSETAQAMAKYIKLGDIATGENSSYAGLVGGIDNLSSGGRMVIWGKIPQNDMRALAIDEASGIPQEQMARMSGVRSSRVADITKIHQAKTYARTRLAWYSNPMSNKRLRDFNYGVEAIMELMGKPEDVARFDFALSCAEGEVAAEVINSMHDSTGIECVDSETLRNLVLFAWSRRSEHIIFMSDAISAILAGALEQGRAYSNEIPLVEMANHRVKLARLAVAAAILTFSVDEEGFVHVGEEHVNFVQDFLDRMYAKPSLDYRGFSQEYRETLEISDANRAPVVAWIKAHAAMARLIYRQSSFTIRDMEDQLGDTSNARTEIARLSALRMVVSNQRGGYKKSAAFIKLLKEIL